MDPVAENVLLRRVFSALADGREPGDHVTVCHGDDVADNNGAHQHECPNVDEQFSRYLSQNYHLYFVFLFVP